MAREELIFRLSLLEQQAEEIRKQINEIESQIMEMENLRDGLEKINKHKEILAPIGRGIFINAEKKENKVFVNVGSKILVKKSLEEAGEIIEKQVNEMERIKHELMKNIQEINLQLQGLVEEAQKSKD